MATETEDTVRLTIDLPKALHQQYKMHCLVKSQSMQDLTERMIKRRVQLAEYDDEEQRIRDMLSR